MRVVALSDTHGQHRKVDIPQCDLLIHCGDFTNNGELHVVKDFGEWFRAQPARIKVLVPGNHDLVFEQNPILALDTLGSDIFVMSSGDKVLVLEDSHDGWGAQEIGINEFLYRRWSAKIPVGSKSLFGASIVPTFGKWAFQPGDEIRERFWGMQRIDFDILVTHCPPKGILDSFIADEGVRVAGCEFLRKYVADYPPKAHFFGHIHEGSGQWVNPVIPAGSYCAFNCALAGRPGQGLTKNPTVVKLRR